MHPKNMGNNIQCTTTNKSPVHLHSYPAALTGAADGGIDGPLIIIQ